VRRHHRQLLDALEKPLCQTPEQGVEMVDASKRSRSIVQVGMQRRSYDLYLKGRDVRRSGALGNVRAVRSWWLNNYLRGGRAQLKGPLDWEQWQGPAPRPPLDPQRFFQWRLFSDYAGGIVARPKPLWWPPRTRKISWPSSPSTMLPCATVGRRIS
jgi:predicted dehydrogenase